MVIEEVLKGIIASNKQYRERFAGITSRTVSAIVRGTPDEFSDIIRAAADLEQGDYGGAQSMEDRDTDGPAGVPLAAAPPVGE